MFCGNCGNKCDDTASFCGKCGKQLPIQKKEKSFGGYTFLIAVIFVIGVFCLASFIKVNNPNKIVGDAVTTEHLFDDKEHSRTIMIYMVGSNLETDNMIASADIDAIKPDEVDLDNVNVLIYTGGTEKWHNFVSNEENAIYELKKSGFEKVKTYSKENMGDPKTLTEFLKYGYDNYKTDRYDLVFYNHGGAIVGAIFDDFSKDHLTLADLEDALDDSPFKGENRLETILFRTCLNGTFEIASTFSNYAYYLIASEEITLGTRTNPVLGYINEIEALDDPIEYGKKYIESYYNMIEVIDPLGTSSVPMYSIIDLTKIDEVNKELDKFIKGLDLKEDYADIVRVRSNMYQYAYTFYNDSDYDMIDLYRFIESIDDYASVSSEDLLKALEDAIEFNWSRDEHSKGLSIYFPYRGTKSVKDGLIYLYNDFNVSKNYIKFIKSFDSLYSSGGNTSFFSNDISEVKPDVEGNEFSITLSEEQVKDYAESRYIVFEKKDDYYMPIYSSDNTKLSGNTLKTNVTNNLVKIFDTKDKGEAYLQLVERTKGGNTSYQATAIVFDFSDGMDTEAVNLHIKYDENSKPFVANTSIIESEDEVISQVAINLEDYDYLQVTNYRYDIIDDNGKYTDKWSSNKDYYLFEVDVDNYDLKRVSLDEGDYYCVFYVYDIYGNVFFSELVSMK